MSDLTRNQKGALAEAAIRAAAIRAGLAVYQPASGHSRADMIFETEHDIWRVQVKCGHLSTPGDVIAAKLGTSYLGAGGYVLGTYKASEIDLIAIYCIELDRAFLLPIESFEGRTSVYLRLSPPRNNQRACTNLAEQYEFAGAVAQLEERRAGSAQARGSSPLSSTDKSPASGPAIVVQANPFRNHLGFWMETVAGGQEVVVTRHGTPRFKLVPVDAESRQGQLMTELTAAAPVATMMRYADLFPREQAA